MNATDDQLEGNVRLTVYVPASMKQSVENLAKKRRQKLSGLMFQVIEKFLIEEAVGIAAIEPSPSPVTYGRRATDQPRAEPEESAALPVA